MAKRWRGYKDRKPNRKQGEARRVEAHENAYAAQRDVPTPEPTRPSASDWFRSLPSVSVEEQRRRDQAQAGLSRRSVSDEAIRKLTLANYYKTPEQVRNLILPHDEDKPTCTGFKPSYRVQLCPRWPNKMWLDSRDDAIQEAVRMWRSTGDKSVVPYLCSEEPEHWHVGRRRGAGKDVQYT